MTSLQLNFLQGDLLLGVTLYKPDNFRPISVVPVLAKLIEKIIVVFQLIMHF